MINNNNIYFRDNWVTVNFNSFCHSIKDSTVVATQKVQAFVNSPRGKEKIKDVVKCGLGVGIGAGIEYPIKCLTDKILKASGLYINYGTPVIPIGLKVIVFPIFCIICPVFEEFDFRRDRQEQYKEKFKVFYLNRGTSEAFANTAARVTAVISTSILFGLYHTWNVIFCLNDPMRVLPQVVHTTILGIFLGMAKELAGSMDVPIGMHMGYNMNAVIRF
ncbi:MAG: CPBP family intramembrane metalloprotease [Candidatus Protochlamydia sp.]|nr:CPBP family intramembrane metalloprotease [Candidatus Protochlamydia sp.]